MTEGDLGRGLADAIGVEYLELGSDRASGRMAVAEVVLQPFGIVHGGVYCAAVEAAASMGAAMTAAERGLATTGVNNNTHYIRTVVGGRLDVVATPIQQGGTQQLWEVRITDDEGRVVALGHVRLQNIPMPG